MAQRLIDFPLSDILAAHVDIGVAAAVSPREEEKKKKKQTATVSIMIANMYTASIARAFDSNAFLCASEDINSRRRKLPVPVNNGFDSYQQDGFAATFSTPKDLPHGKMEKALLQKGLGDCTGLKVLDIAGGSGDHARQAIEAGAESVDVVDTSKPMMEVGKKIEKDAGRDSINFYCGDAAIPLWQQLPDLPIQGYDVVLAFWPFDHAGTMEELVVMWKNISAYLKPGGRLVGARVHNPWSRCVHEAKYGTRVTLIEQTATRAVKCQIIVNTTPPFTFWSCSMEQSLRGDTYIPNKLGITDIQNLDPRDTELVKDDPDFWIDFVEDPYFVAFTGKKFSPSLAPT